MYFKASAPGSLMLLGEHAVLQGYPALVCAVDKRIAVTLEPRRDKKIYIQSSLGTHQTRIDEIQVVKPFEFVLTTLKQYQQHFQFGFNLTIDAEFLSTVGFASSAAVTVATLSALFAYLEFSCSLNDFLRYARQIVRTVQGMGSGADVAACVYGGLISYKAEPLAVERFLNAYALTVVYSGSKTPTPQVVSQVKTAFQNKQAELSNIMRQIGSCAERGIQAVANRDWLTVGKIMDAQQLQMAALGVNTPLLQEIIDELRGDEAILGAKISGSGLGDCVVGLGISESAFQTKVPGAVVIPVEITKQGVYCEKN